MIQVRDYATSIDVEKVTEAVGRGPIPDWCFDAADWEDVESTAITEAEFVKRLRVLMRRPQSTRSLKSEDLEELAPLAETTSRITALLANRDWRVTWFRSHLLGGNLVPSVDVAAWVERRRQDESRGDAESRVARARSQGLATMWLEVQTETSSGIRIDGVEVLRDGDLGALWTLVQGLAMDYHWPPGAALAFLLSGETPLRRPAYLVAVDVGETERGELLHIAVDPLMMNPEQLKRWYAILRRQLLAGRYEQPDARAQRLALFILEDDDEHGPAHVGTWAQRHARWRQRSDLPDEWEFNDWRSFKRATELALKRFTEPPLRSLDDET